MTSEAAPLSQNSTNVRVYTVYQSLQRLAFRLFGTLFPRTAARWFERVLLTPRRKPAPFDANASLLTGEISRVPYGSGWLNVWSAGEGPTVLLLHGWGAQAAHLDGFIDPLLAAGFRVVAFDAPGHGASAGKMTNLVECIGATLQVARSAGPIHGMIAHSFGTALATFAVKYGLEVDRMVFLAPPLSVTEHSHNIGELIGLPRRVTGLVQRRVEQRLHIKWEDFDTDKAVADIDVPLLVLHDQKDRRVPWSDGEAIARAAKNGKLVTTSGLGHRMILRDERVIAQAVDFLSGRMGAVQAASRPPLASSARVTKGHEGHDCFPGAKTRSVPPMIKQGITHDRETPIERAGAPHGTKGPARVDFGYSWFWTYGHLLPAAALTTAAIASAQAGGPDWLTVGSGAIAIWAFAGFLVMRFVVRMNELGPLPSPDFATGTAHVLDLGCGSGRTSIVVAKARPKSRITALDNFSADYIDGHGEANTRENFVAAGVSDRVEIRSGDMCRLPFPDASFDAVVSSAAIDHLERGDIPIALAEANRVLRENGQVLLWLIVPNLWNLIATGPLAYLHGSNLRTRVWREMLGTAGFRIDAEGTARGLAWIQATRAREAAVPVAADPA